MGFSRGPNIVRNGLIAHYDGANIKSFRGEPTTNLLADPIDMTQWGGQQITVDSTPAAYHVIDGQTIPFYKVTSTSNIDPFHSDATDVGAISGKTFSFYIWAYTDEGQSTFAQVYQYGSNPFNSSTVSANTYTLTTEPQKCYVTNTYATDVTNTQIATRIDLQQGGSLGYIYVGGAQLEEKSAPTKFVDGTRGTTVSTGGGLVDISKNGNHADLFGSPSSNSNNYGAISFDGTSDYARGTGGVNSYPEAISDKFSLEVWVNIPSSATWTNGFYGNIISKGSYPGFVGLARTSTDNQVVAYLRGNTSGVQSTTGTITRDEWHHLVMTYDGGTSRLYINGASQGSSSTAMVGGFEVNSWRIAEATAAGGNVGNAFEGQMSAIKFYNRDLTADEVLQNYNALKTRFGK